MAGYSIHEFAALAGVTVKALRHYDRLALLRPGRVGTGRYRRYQTSDLERLEQIVALKFLGLPLKQVGELVLGKENLRVALEIQLRAIEQKRLHLDRAARVVRMAGEALASGEPASTGLLRQVIEVVQMQDSVAAMKKYYSEVGFERRRRYYEEGPAEEWHQLYREVGTALSEDPGSPRAQELADRWFALSLRAYQGDPDVQTDSPGAWMDREHWPEEMKRRIAQFNLEAVHEFIHKADVGVRKQYFAPGALERYQTRWQRESEGFCNTWQARIDLFQEVEAALGDSPESNRARQLAERWLAQLDESSFGDAEVRAGLMKTWADRANWGPRLRWQYEGIYMMSYDRLLLCADFLDTALAVAMSAALK